MNASCNRSEAPHTVTAVGNWETKTPRIVAEQHCAKADHQTKLAGTHARACDLYTSEIISDDLFYIARQIVHSTYDSQVSNRCISVTFGRQLAPLLNKTSGHSCSLSCRCSLLTRAIDCELT